MLLNAIKQMERASRNDPEVVSLSQGIPFQASDPAIRQAAISAILSGQADRYSDPQGLPELRQAIAETLQEQAMDYAAAEVIVTAGAIEGLNSVLHTVVTSERNEVIMPVPVYSAYSRAVELAGGKVVPVPLDALDRWRLNIALVRRAITPRTAAILICNPNNPTGSVYSKQTLSELAGLAKRHGTAIISDEVYGNMLYDGTESFSPAMLPPAKPHVVRIVSFSKDFALTGWRVGYVHAAAARIDALVAVHDTLVNCAPVVSQHAALEALRQRRRILNANQLTYQRHRRIMAEYLQALGPAVSYMMPEGAYFFFVKVQGVTNSTDFCLQLLKAQKLAVVPGDDFGPGGEGYVRLCFGRSAPAIHAGMRRFTAFVHARRAASKSSF